MIQRKQSLYLIASAIFFVLVWFILPFFITNFELVDKGSIFKTSIFWTVHLAAALSILNIFMFKNRKIQSLFCLVIAAIADLLIIFMAIFSKDITQVFTHSSTLPVWVAIGFTMLASVFAVLAYRGVKRDIVLLRSLDRIR